jgi:pyruvate formate lyase activating enzyme
MPPDELVEEVDEGQPLFPQVGRGRHISGGEPTLQMDYIAEVFGKLHDLGIHTAIESHGHFSDGDRERLIPLVDQFLIDLKHMDSKKHEEYTGYGNEQVLRNRKSSKTMGLPYAYR